MARGLEAQSRGQGIVSSFKLHAPSHFLAAALGSCGIRHRRRWGEGRKGLGWYNYNIWWYPLAVAVSIDWFSWCGIICGSSIYLLGSSSCGFYDSSRVRQTEFHSPTVVLSPLQTSFWMGTLWKMTLEWLSPLHPDLISRKTYAPSGNATPSQCFHLSNFLSALFSQAHVTHLTLSPMSENVYPSKFSSVFSCLKVQSRRHLPQFGERGGERIIATTLVQFFPRLFSQLIFSMSYLLYPQVGWWANSGRT